MYDSMPSKTPNLAIEALSVKMFQGIQGGAPGDFGVNWL